MLYSVSTQATRLGVHRWYLETEHRARTANRGDFGHKQLCALVQIKLDIRYRNRNFHVRK